MKRMKKLIFTAGFLFIAGLFLLNSCGSKIRTFAIPEDENATKLTIGWYLPVTALTEIVSPNFKPQVVKDGDKGLMLLVITTGSQHKVDGHSVDSLKMANLMIAVEPPNQAKKQGAVKTDEFYICPMIIVEKSKNLDRIFKEFGFKTYLGKINLQVNQKNERYNIKAFIKNDKGTIVITGFFNEQPSTHQSVVAVFNSQPKNFSYYSGNEISQRFINGRGVIDNQETTLIKAMQLENHPFFMKLDMNSHWNFEFLK